MTALLELSRIDFYIIHNCFFDGQVLDMLFKVILVNFNESISKITEIIMIIIMLIMMCFILSWQDVGIVQQ